MSTKKYKISSDKYLFRKESDGALVFDPDNGNIYALNKTGAILWRACAHGATVDGMVKIIRRRFKFNEEKKIRRDILKFLKNLRRGDFISEE